MNRIAVDVVLLPETAIAERAIQLNAQLGGEHNSEIALHPETCRPHITLAMGCIDPESIPIVGGLLQDVASERRIEPLTVTGVLTTLNAKGWSVSSLAIAKTVPLQLLHERIIEVMQHYVTYDVTQEMIYGHEAVADSTLNWIRAFRQKSSFGAYFPHITLGYGTVTEPMTFPMECKPARLALCHLGNHCTCRKVLASVDL